MLATPAADRREKLGRPNYLDDVGMAADDPEALAVRCCGCRCVPMHGILRAQVRKESMRKAVTKRHPR